MLADLERYRDTAFGKAHGFESIRTEADFRERVPARNYEEYRSWITQVTDGEQEVLPCGEILAFERTSGTSSGAKLIPVTEGLRRLCPRDGGLDGRMEGAVRRFFPERRIGRSLLPASRAAILRVAWRWDWRAMARISPIGSAQGWRNGWWFPPNGGPSEFFAETAEALLRTPDLSLVSVWSPTFLLCIDAEVARRRPGKTWREIWPKLALVSCWADASSARWIPRLRVRLGGIPIEPKGLLATEGVTSIPAGRAGSPRLAHECHYHEFLSRQGKHLPLERLRIGAVCEILLSTSGGLLRYRSGDLVKITGFAENGFPRMRFLGRKGTVSDLVGEKLAEETVASAFASAGACGFLAADPDAPGYEIWIENTGMAGQIVSRLLENPYFEQAVNLGQLRQCRPMFLGKGWVRDFSAALARKHGCRIGDVKLPVLYRQNHSGEVAEWLG